jgi:hypothetical protein
VIPNYAEHLSHFTPSTHAEHALADFFASHLAHALPSAQSEQPAASAHAFAFAAQSGHEAAALAAQSAQHGLPGSQFGHSKDVFA